MTLFFVGKHTFANLCNRLQKQPNHDVLFFFYCAIAERISRYGIIAWFGNLTAQLKNKLANMHQTTRKIIGRREYESVQSLYEQEVMKQARKIISDSQHPIFPEYESLPSGKRLHMQIRSPKNIICPSLNLID